MASIILYIIIVKTSVITEGIGELRSYILGCEVFFSCGPIPDKVGPISPNLCPRTSDLVQDMNRLFNLIS